MTFHPRKWVFLASLFVNISCGGIVFKVEGDFNQKDWPEIKDDIISLAVVEDGDASFDTNFYKDTALRWLRGVKDSLTSFISTWLAGGALEKILWWA